MCILVPGESTIKNKKDIPPKSTDKLKWNTEIYSHKPKQGRKVGTEQETD